LVGSSPRLIAASYVLRRLLAPRHPPCALCNLATFKDARARYVVLKVPGPVPWWPTFPDQPGGLGPGRASGSAPQVVDPDRRRGSSSRAADAPSKLNSVCDQGHSALRRSTTHDRDRRRYWAAAERPGRVASDRPWSGQACEWTWLPGSPHRRGLRVLLRKEVIQPHLPVRLPCYDFVPIANPTFDSSLPYGLGHWLRVLPTFVT